MRTEQEVTELVARVPSSPVRERVRSFLRHRLAEHELPPEAICRSCGGQGVVPAGRPSSMPPDARRVPLPELEGRIVALESRIEEIDHTLVRSETLRNGDQCRFLTHERRRLVVELKPLDAEWSRRAATSVADEAERPPGAARGRRAVERYDRGDCRACHGLGIRPPAELEAATSMPAFEIGGRRADRAFVSRAAQVLQAHEARAPRGWPRDLVDRMLNEIDDGDARPDGERARSRLDVIGNLGLLLAAILLAWAAVRLALRIL